MSRRIAVIELLRLPGEMLRAYRIGRDAALAALLEREGEVSPESDTRMTRSGGCP